MSDANPVWILPGHPPASPPPYEYYPATAGGPVLVPVFLYFQSPPAANVTVTLTSSSNVFQEVPTGTQQITMTGQYLGMTLTCPVVPPDPASAPALAVTLRVTDPTGPIGPHGPQHAMAVVHLNRLPKP